MRSNIGMHPTADTLPLIFGNRAGRRVMPSVMRLFLSRVGMRKVTAALVFLISLTAAEAHSQEPPLIKSPEESLQAFGARVIPSGMKLAHKVVRGDFGPSKGNVVVLFHERDEREFTGWILIPGGRSYGRYILPPVRLPISTKIKAVFFGNADSDPERELLILCEHISGVGRYPGNVTPFWTTYVYDWNGQGFSWLENMTMNLDAVGRTRTVKGVRRLLRRQGL